MFIFFLNILRDKCDLRYKLIDMQHSKCSVNGVRTHEDITCQPHEKIALVLSNVKASQAFCAGYIRAYILIP